MSNFSIFLNSCIFLILLCNNIEVTGVVVGQELKEALLYWSQLKAGLPITGITYDMNNVVLSELEYIEHIEFNLKGGVWIIRSYIPSGLY